MNKKVITIIYLVIFALNSDAQSQYNLIYERQIGMNFAGENFVAGLHLIDYADSLFIPKFIIKEDSDFARVANPIYRFGKLFLTNYLITDFIMTMNHERFGHGYRILQADGEIVEIVYSPPPPFGSEFSYISFNRSSNHTIQQDLTVNFGGSEANMVLSDIVRKNILLDERFSHNLAFPYLYGSNDAPGYTAFVSNPYSDPNKYIENINNLYGGEGLTRKKMRTYSFLALLTDPMNFYALKSVFHDYLIKGKHSTKVGMIKFSNRIKYLPRFRFEYTPYGPELVIQNYLKFDNKLFQLSFSHSDGTFNPSWRLTAEAWNISATEKLSFNFKGQIWNQPEINYFVNDNFTIAVGGGGQAIATTNYNLITDKHTLGATLQIGYKTKGYTLGEQLNESLILRGGLTFRLGNKSQ